MMTSSQSAKGSLYLLGIGHSIYFNANYVSQSQLPANVICYENEDSSPVVLVSLTTEITWLW